MKRTLLAIGAVVGLLVVWNLAGGTKYMEYRGERIKLSKYYLDYESYKDDPANIDPSETSRVQRLVSEAPVPHSFDSREEMIRALFEIKFPGYGAAGLGDGGSGEGSITGLSVEIPRADKNRYLSFQCKGGKYLLIDDFIESGPLLTHVQQTGNNLTYSSWNGQQRLNRVAKYR